MSFSLCCIRCFCQDLTRIIHSAISVRGQISKYLTKCGFFSLYWIAGFYSPISLRNICDICNAFLLCIVQIRFNWERPITFVSIKPLNLLEWIIFMSNLYVQCMYVVNLFPTVWYFFYFHFISHHNVVMKRK